MKLNFRHGLISFQQSGPQALFLVPSVTPGFVGLNVAPTAFIATIAHGSSDYLLKFDASVPTAWGPMVPGVDNYLFLELNLITGVVSYGLTTVEPVSSSVEPPPTPGLMWFDLNAASMKVRNAGNAKWIESPRVLVGVVENGNVNQIVHKPVGSTVGLNTPGNPGFLMLDAQLRPLRTQSGELLTSDTEVRIKTTVGTSGVLTNPSNGFVPVRANEPIPAMSLVYISSEHGVSLASSNPALLTPKTPVGVVETALGTNEYGVITQSGEITYDQWNWAPSDIGKPLYCGFNGEIQTARPLGLQVFRVGYVKSPKTILFYIDSETFPQVYSAPGALISGVPPISAVTAPNVSSELVTTISMEAATDLVDGYMTAAQAAALQTFDSRIIANENGIIDLETNKTDVGHVHIVSDVTGLQGVLDGKSDVGHTHAQYSLTTHTHVQYADLNHVHLISEVTDLQTALNGKSDVGHGHDISDVTDLQLELNNRAFTNHSHIISNVTGLQGALDGKAATVHAHAIADVTGLQGALDGKSAVGHGHLIADTTGLQSALNGKSDTGHTHVASDVTDFIETVDDRVSSLLVQGSNVTLTYDDNAGTLTIDAASGIAAPGGADTQIQYNDTGDFNGDAAFTFNKVTGVVTATNDLIVNGITVGKGAGQGGDTAVGTDALSGGNISSPNAAFGLNALKALLFGSHNVAIGPNTMSSGIGATSSTAVGSNALTQSGGGSNTGIGKDAGIHLISGTGNIYLGVSAGQGGLDDEQNVIVIGNNIQSAGNGTIVIGHANDNTDAYINASLSVSDATNKKALKVYGEVFANGSEGNPGDVLTSSGAGFPAVWQPSSVPPTIPTGGYFLVSPIVSMNTETSDWTRTYLYEIDYTPVSLTGGSLPNSFVAEDDGTYRIRVQGKIVLDDEGPVAWPDGISAFGVVLNTSNSGVDTFAYIDRSIHTRFGAVGGTTSNASLSSSQWSATFHDEFHVAARAGESIQVAAYTEALEAGIIQAEFSLLVVVEYVSASLAPLV